MTAEPSEQSTTIAANGASKSDAVAIGIDFGTLNITIAAIDGGEPTIIQSRQGGDKMPAYIAHVEADVLVGEDAQSCALTEPEHVLFCMKRFLGLNAGESHQITKHYRFPFQVAEDARGVCDFGKYRVDAMKAMRTLLKEASAAIHERFTVFGPVAITLPDIFWEKNERKTFEPIFQDIIQSAITAGFHRPVLIPEIHAAFLGSRPYLRGDSVLVIHIGAAYFGTAHYMYNADNKNFLNNPEFILTDQIICGNDFDVKIIDHFAVTIKKDVATVDKETYEILRKHCQKAKMDLSAGRNATVNIEELANERHRFVFSRKEFEEICSDLFDKFENFLLNTIKHNYPDVENVSDIILTGGSARIPKIQQIILETFGKRPNPAVLGLADTVSANGAALFAKEAANRGHENIGFRRPLPITIPREHRTEPQFVSDEPVVTPGPMGENICAEERENATVEEIHETTKSYGMTDAVTHSVSQTPERNQLSDKDCAEAPSWHRDVPTILPSQIGPDPTEKTEILIEKLADATKYMDSDPASSEVHTVQHHSLNALPNSSPDERQNPVLLESVTLTEVQHEDSNLTLTNEQPDDMSDAEVTGL